MIWIRQSGAALEVSRDIQLASGSVGGHDLIVMTLLKLDCTQIVMTMNDTNQDEILGRLCPNAGVLRSMLIYE